MTNENEQEGFTWDEAVIAPLTGEQKQEPTPAPEAKAEDPTPAAETEIQQPIEESFVFNQFDEEDETKAVDTSEVSEGNKEKAKKALKDKEVAEQEVVEFYNSKTKLMMESGIFDKITEDDVPEDINEESYVQLQKLQVDRSINDVFAAYKEKLKDDPAGYAFMQHSFNGGTFADFKEKLNIPVSFKDLDPTNTEHHESIVSRYLTKVEGKDQEDVTDIVNLYKDKEKLKIKAEAYHAKMLKQENDNATNIERQARESREERENKRIADKQKYEKIITEEDALASIATKNIKKDMLAGYITDPKHKLSGNQYLTGFQQTIRNILDSPSGTVQLAALTKLYDTDKGQFDLSSIVKKGKKDTVAKVKNTLMNKTVPTTASSAKTDKASSGSLFDEFV